MEDKLLNLAREYCNDIKNSYRYRGHLYIETSEGLRQLHPYSGYEARQIFENELKTDIKTWGYQNTDFSHKNKEDNYLTFNQYGEAFILRDWYAGEEGSLENDKQMLSAASNLAILHTAMQGQEYQVSPYNGHQPPLRTTFEKRLTEIKRAARYMQQKKDKNNFEKYYLNIYPEIISQAEEALWELDKLNFDLIYQDIMNKHTLIHGSYTFHNIIFSGNHAIATVSFDKAAYGLQITDLYQLTRKVMEKNNWDISLGQSLIKAYNREKPISEEELKILYILLLFPEKYWKITNNYFNNKKAWVPCKNVQKLSDTYKSSDAKHSFLQSIT